MSIIIKKMEHSFKQILSIKNVFLSTIGIKAIYLAEHNKLADH